MEQEILNFVRSRKTKRFLVEEVQEYLLEHNHLYRDLGGYKVFAATINKLVEKGKIKPVKSKKQNSLNPPLYLCYQIQEKNQLEVETLRVLLNTFHPKMSMLYYFTRPEEYQADEKYLKRIDRYLKENGKKETYYISPNERSFELFEDEKWLMDEGLKVLQKISLSLEDLNCYPTHEPFFYYRRSPHEQKGTLNVLIVENKDTFYSLKALFREGIYSWLGTAFDMLVYGEGKKILRSYYFFSEIEEIKGRELDCFYFGDVDPEGVNIFASLKERMIWNVTPFVPFYEALIERYNGKTFMRKREQKLQQNALSTFLVHFSKETQREIESIIYGTRYLPQEGLTKYDLHLLSS